MIDDLIGKLYPVRDLTNNVISALVIKKLIHSQNSAGAMIVFDDPNTGIYIGYVEAMELLEKNKIALGALS